MKHHHLLPAIAIVATVAASTSVHAQTPALIPYQGRVQTGDPAVDFNGTGQFKFALVDETPIPFVQATATVTRAAGVQSLAGATFTVTNGGTGYATPPAVTVSAPQVGGGVQATVTATVSGGRVTGFTVGTAGSGYTANPTLTIAAPPVAGPTIIWNNNGPAPAAPVNAVNLNVDRGLYSVLLGDRSIANMAVIPPAVFTRPDLRLRVWFNGTQLSPDQRLAPNGYLPNSIGSSSFEINNGTTGFQILPGKLFGTTDATATTLEMPGAATLGIYDNLEVWNDLSFPGDFAHSISVKPTTTNTNGSPLYVRAGNASPPPSGSGLAKKGGDLVLSSGRGYGGFPGITGGDIYITTEDSYNNAGTPIGLSRGNIYLQPGNGKVGLNTTTPLAPLHVAGGTTNSFTLEAYLGGGGVADVSEFRSDLAHSIIADLRIRASGGFDVASDARIKKIQRVSDGSHDLATLRRLEITDYTYIDQVGQDTRPQKKVIAQQVEKALPAAIIKSTGVVPDIYRKAQARDGWVRLSTTLKQGEKVRIIDASGTTLHDVAEVKEDAFRTAAVPKDGDVFVYGREVKDFRTVDYDAIAMLNVSATQELARRLDAAEARAAALEKENTALKAELAASAARDEAQDAKLTTLAALLEKRADDAATTTAGVTTQR